MAASSNPTATEQMYSSAFNFDVSSKTYHLPVSSILVLLFTYEEDEIDSFGTAANADEINSTVTSSFL